jgi:hypothetical protein
MCDGDLEKWLCDITGVENLDMAKMQVSRAVELASILPKIGALTLLISPAGVLDTIVSQKLVSNVEGLETLEMALLEVQQGIIRTRRQLNEKTNDGKTEPAVDKQVAPKKRQRVRSNKAKSATPSDEEIS